MIEFQYESEKLFLLNYNFLQD